MNGRPQSVCMLVYSFPPESTGGAERQCQLQAEELVRQGQFECLVLCARQYRIPPRKTQSDGLEIVRVRTAESLWRKQKKPTGTSSVGFSVSNDKTLAKWRSFASRALVQAVRWMNAACFMIGAGWIIFRRRHDISVIHVHGADWHAGFAGWMGQRLGLPVLCKGANLPAFPDLSGIPLSTVWNAWRRRISYIALTPAMRDDLISNGVPSDRIDILPNGVELPSLAADPEARNLVLHVANYTQPAWNKAFDVLFDAWPQVVSKCPTARLATAGAGDVSPWRNKMESTRCSDSVDFLGFRADLKDWCQRAAVFVLPSRAEGISNALLEAQAAGLPAVVSDIPGNRAVVIDGETGLVVPAGDVDALAGALVRLLSDADLRRRLGSGAHRRVMAEFSIEQVVLNLSAIYTRMVEK